MRAVSLPLAALVVLSILPSPAAATSCGTSWSAPASCGFICNGPTLTVTGTASFPGAIASVTATATCGLAQFGAVTTLLTASCNASGPGSASCTSTVPNPFFAVSNVATCAVSGTNQVGTYSCSS